MRELFLQKARVLGEEMNVSQIEQDPTEIRERKEKREKRRAERLQDPKLVAELEAKKQAGIILSQKRRKKTGTGIAHIEKRKAALKRRRKAIFQALYRKPSERKDAIPGTESLFKRGLVSLIEIPIFDQRLTQATPLDGQSTPIVVFSVEDREKMKGVMSWEWQSSLTKQDLEYLCQTGKVSPNLGKPSLVRLDNLFVEAIDGTGISAAKRYLGNRETSLALIRLRDVAEHTIKTWVDMNAVLQGQHHQDDKDKKGSQSYLDRAKKAGLISRSDYAQSKAFMFVGNAAVHQSDLAYHRLSAILFTHWLDDLVGRTIGHHRMRKSRENGTSFSDNYEYTTEAEEYDARMAIFDSFQHLKRESAKIPAQKDIAHLEDGDVYKENLMGSAIRVLDRFGEICTNLNAGERALLNVVNFWKKELKKPRREMDFTAQDAIRAAMLAYSQWFESKDIDTERLEDSRTVFGTIDSNRTVAVKKKAMTTRRYERYNLENTQSPNQPEFEEDLRTVVRTANQYFPNYMSPAVKQEIAKAMHLKLN